jgi:hypothetical protein
MPENVVVNSKNSVSGTLCLAQSAKNAVRDNLAADATAFDGFSHDVVPLIKSNVMKRSGVFAASANTLRS